MFLEEANSVEEEGLYFIKDFLLKPFFLSEKRNCRWCYDSKRPTTKVSQECLNFLCRGE